MTRSRSGLHLVRMMGNAFLKMLIVLEVLGANENCKMVPFKCENLLGYEVLREIILINKGGLRMHVSI